MNKGSSRILCFRWKRKEKYNNLNLVFMQAETRFVGTDNSKHEGISPRKGITIKS